MDGRIMPGKGLTRAYSCKHLSFLKLSTFSVSLGIKRVMHKYMSVQFKRLLLISHSFSAFCNFFVKLAKDCLVLKSAIIFFFSKCYPSSIKFLGENEVFSKCKPNISQFM